LFYKGDFTDPCSLRLAVLLEKRLRKNFIEGESELRGEEIPTRDGRGGGKLVTMRGSRRFLEKNAGGTAYGGRGRTPLPRKKGYR